MDKQHVLERLADAALARAGETPFSQLSLRDLADAAELSIADACAAAKDKSAVVDALARRFDRVAADEFEMEPEASLRERVFDAAMARFDAMEPHRAALKSIIKAEGEDAGLMVRAWARLSRSARWLLEVAGVDASGARGAARVQGFAAILARTTRAWMKDDAGDLSRTMATLDRHLRDVEDWAGRWPFGRRRQEPQRGEDETDAEPAQS